MTTLSLKLKSMTMLERLLRNTSALFILKCRRFWSRRYICSSW